MKETVADPVAAELLIANGYDGSGHKSSLLTESKIDGADLILVMEGSQGKLILDQFP
jgi:protein-tyrosine-phosphatase